MEEKKQFMPTVAVVEVGGDNGARFKGRGTALCIELDETDFTRLSPDRNDLSRRNDATPDIAPLRPDLWGETITLE